MSVSRHAGVHVSHNVYFSLCVERPDRSSPASGLQQGAGSSPSVPSDAGRGSDPVQACDSSLSLGDETRWQHPDPPSSVLLRKPAPPQPIRAAANQKASSGQSGPMGGADSLSESRREPEALAAVRSLHAWNSTSRSRRSASSESHLHTCKIFDFPPTRLQTAVTRDAARFRQADRD